MTIIMYRSTWSRNSTLDMIAVSASKIGIFPTIDTKGNTAKASSKEENQQAH